MIGLRGGAWEPGLFLAVPLVVCFFSYLFSVCVFLGVVTRSTLAALLVTLLFWFLVFSVGAAENLLLTFHTMDKHGVTLEDMQAASRAAKEPAENQAPLPDKPSEEEQEEALQADGVRRDPSH